MKKRILFITPPFHAGVVEVAGRWVPLNMVYLAGSARAAGLEPFIYDAMTKGIGHEEIEAKIKEIRPDYVATGAITCTLPDALKVLETAKRLAPSIITILGGIHPTFMHEEVFSKSPHVDFIVRGEGELTLKELLSALKEGAPAENVKGVAYRIDGVVRVTDDRPLMSGAELDSLPKAWDLLDWEDYSYFVVPGARLGALDTSRGCDKDCDFCSQRKFWRTSWRSRTPEGLVSDMEEQKKYGVNTILLTDDYPTKDRQRWVEFLDLLIERKTGVHILMETRAGDIIRDVRILHKYRRAGIIHIYVGTEATDQRTLDLLKKDITVEEAKIALTLLNRHGIITETSMILGLLDETRCSIERTLSLAMEYNPDFCHFLAISPWPYADMYEKLRGRIRVFDYRRYNLIDPVVEPYNMTLSEIDGAIVDCYRRFYMGKLKEVVSLKDEFKRNYMLAAMKLMMTNSFLINKLGDLGKIPEEVEKHLKSEPEKPPESAKKIAAR
jgi:anaerobic magnesium-protoporphyrin IX monomethyl ester cyclase